MNHSLYLIAGLGKTGLSIARYLRRRNKPFVAFDTRIEAPGLHEFKTEFPDVPVYLQEVPDALFSQLTDVIASPGLSLDTPCIKKALEDGIAVYGDVECLVREISAPIIAITGTNGKSTVTTLVGEMAKASGIKVAVAGNIGAPVLDMLDNGEHYDLWVLELSSFQLDLTYSMKPLVATILNVTPDHLDRHQTLETYIRVKQRVYHQAQVALFNRQDVSTQPVQEDRVLNCLSFGQDEPTEENWGLIQQNNTVFLARGKEAILSVDSLLIKGTQNWLNALAACALAEVAGIALDSIQEVLKTFPGLPHRCQWVRSLDAIEWINDSKGTNVGATASAIEGIGGSMQGKIVLIAGGQGKGADFNVLSQPVADFVRSIVLIGVDADKIETALSPVVPTHRASSLDDAVTTAKAQAKPGDVVLLSPACASLDMFRDFNHRGEQFVTLVNGL